MKLFQNNIVLLGMVPAFLLRHIFYFVSDHVSTIPDSFHAGVKIIPDRPSVSTRKVIIRHDLHTIRKLRNACAKSTRKAKKEYFQNLDMNDITDNRTVKPWFISKGIKGTKKIILVEKGEII